MWATSSSASSGRQYETLHGSKKYYLNQHLADKKEGTSRSKLVSVCRFFFREWADFDEVALGLTSGTSYVNVAHDEINTRFLRTSIQ